MELILFKICDIPTIAAECWLGVINQGKELNPGNWIGLNEKIDIGGEITEICIYRSNAGYHLIQNPEEE